MANEPYASACSSIDNDVGAIEDMLIIGNGTAELILTSFFIIPVAVFV